MDSFFGIGIGELFFIAVIALIVLGPERLPSAIRSVAKFFREVRKMINELSAGFGDELKTLEDLNPQKLLRELTEDPEEEKAAAKPAAKTTTPAKPTTPKPATPKTTTPNAQAKPATSTTTPAKPSAAAAPMMAPTSSIEKPSTVRSRKPWRGRGVSASRSRSTAVRPRVTGADGSAVLSPTDDHSVRKVR